MRKIVLALFLVLATATGAFADDDKGFDLKKTPWGQNIQDTAKVLGVPVKEGAENIVIMGPNVFGYKSAILYIFEDDKLICLSQMVPRALNAQLDEKALRVLFARMGNTYDDLMGKGNRIHKKYYGWVMQNGDYLFLNDEFGDGRINLRRMPKEIWDKYWAHQLK